LKGRSTKEFFGCKIMINEKDAPLLEGVKADGTFRNGDMLFGLKVIEVPDNKTPGESAFLWEERKMLFVGDSVVGKPMWKLNLLQDDKYQDAKKAAEGIRVLYSLNYDIMLVGDGEHPRENGKEYLKAFFERHELKV
ncbi:MAG: hypothetical protein QMD85_05715, partial [Candidatus Aenigmarchaeota archaeon]|nr:hypothetical protein [Candidatus Aenigmarchaeota archaeon]